MERTEELRRISTLARQDVVQMIYEAHAGHVGGSLSIMDILTALYYGVMNVDPRNPQWEDRDRLVLSKGHAAPALYVTLMNKGYFSREHLGTLRKMGSILQGHPDMRKTPGLDFTSGSLGNGLGLGNGMALAARLSGKDYHTYVILGDGELQEGTVWESAMTAGAKKLSNLTAIVDINGLQVEGAVKDIKDLGDLRGKWESFGFAVTEVDGHDMEQLYPALLRTKEPHDRPMAILAHTVKGKGLSFAEGQMNWHKGDFTPENYAQAMRELKEALEG